MDNNNYNNNNYNDNNYNDNYNNNYNNGGFNNNAPYNMNNGYNNQMYNQPEKKNSLGIASMVCGIIALLLFCCCESLSITLGLAGIILGAVSLKRQESNKGFAIAGIITGSCGLVFAIFLMIVELYMRQTGIYDQIYNEVLRNMYDSLGIDPNEINNGLN